MATDADTALRANPLNVRVLRDSAGMRGLEDCRRYALVEVEGGEAQRAERAGDRLVAPLASGDGELCTVDASHCLRAPSGLDEAGTLLLPPVIAALEAWSALGLELGEVALVCGEAPLSVLLLRSARWCGALPVIALGSRISLPAGVATIATDDPDEAIARIERVAGARAGFAAVDLSGRSLYADILLQALPRWGRLHLGGRDPEPLTIDFYKDVHVKGARVHTAPFGPESVFADPLSRGALARRATRLLQMSERRSEVAALFAG